jgi:hypothetical protein
VLRGRSLRDSHDDSGKLPEVRHKHDLDRILKAASKASFDRFETSFDKSRGAIAGGQHTPTKIDSPERRQLSIVPLEQRHGR